MIQLRGKLASCPFIYRIHPKEEFFNMRIHIFFNFFLFTTLTSCQSLVELVQSQPDLSTLLVALQAVPRFTERLAGASDVTILAPTNDAFAKVPQRSPLGEAIAQAGMATPDMPAPGPVRAGIRALLAYHVLKGSYPAFAAMKTPVFVPTLQDSSFIVDGMPITNVTGGQNVGIVMGDDGGVNIVSGGLGMSKVVQAVSSPSSLGQPQINKLTFSSRTSWPRTTSSFTKSTRSSNSP